MAFTVQQRAATIQALIADLTTAGALPAGAVSWDPDLEALVLDLSFTTAALSRAAGVDAASGLAADTHLTGLTSTASASFDVGPIASDLAVGILLADKGPNSGDRMFDWVGAYNITYLCLATRGAYVTIRDQRPGLIDYLLEQAATDGGLTPAVKTSSGGNEVAMVYKPDVNKNANPVCPGTPGHFSCPAGARSVRHVSRHDLEGRTRRRSERDSHASRTSNRRTTAVHGTRPPHALRSRPVAPKTARRYVASLTAWPSQSLLK